VTCFIWKNIQNIYRESYIKGKPKSEFTDLEPYPNTAKKMFSCVAYCDDLRLTTFIRLFYRLDTVCWQSF